MPRWRLLSIGIVFATLAGLPGWAQQRVVDTRKAYERVYAVVPMTGSGTLADPLRPKYAPLPSAVSPKVRTGIIGYHFVLARR